MTKNIQVIDDLPGHGRPAEKGCSITYNARIFLRRGDEVTQDFRSIDAYGDRLETRLIDNIELIDHKIVLGKRQAIAGVEKALVGMMPGSYREVVVAPHLAYGSNGLGDVIPANALLRIRLWVQDVTGEA